MNTLTKAAVQGAACGLMMGAVLLAGWRVWHPATVADVVRARRFMVQNEDGKLRASLGSEGLTLFDRAEKVRAILEFNASAGSSLRLWGAAEYGMAEISVSTPTGASLRLYDSAILRAKLSLFSGAPNLELYDAAGKVRAALGNTHLEDARTGEVRTRSESSLVLFDKDGKVMREIP
jgi:hypothetical protein